VEPVARDEDEQQQNAGLEREVHEGDSHGRERQDLVRERHLLHQVRVVDHRTGAAAHRGGEQVPGEQAREQVHRIVRDARAEHARDEGEDRQIHDRVQERPEGSEDRGRVLDLELAADEVQQDLAPGEDLAGAGAGAEPGGLGRPDGDLGGGCHRVSARERAALGVCHAFRRVSVV
jgi:hypothetical protein